ncbi:hypothetical protein Tco_0965479 [Tanacetum coccineum]
MDDPNITMEEYIRLTEEKARKRRKVLNWETAKYGETISCEPMSSYVTDEIDLKISFDDSDNGDYTRPVGARTHSGVLQHVRFGETMTDFDTTRALQFQFGGATRHLSWRQFILALGLHTAEEMETIRFGAYWAERARLIACSIAGRSQAPEKRGSYLRGQFVAQLAEHFGLLTEERLQGLTVTALTLPVIDMAELVRLQICVEIDDTWAWVALGPERQPDAAAGAPEAAEVAHVVDEGDQAVLAPVQAPPPPPAAVRTMPQRMSRFAKDVYEIHGALAEQHEVIGAMARDFSRFIVYAASGPRESNIDEYWWRIYNSEDLEVLES